MIRLSLIGVSVLPFVLFTTSVFVRVLIGVKGMVNFHFYFCNGFVNLVRYISNDSRCYDILEHLLKHVIVRVLNGFSAVYFNHVFPI